MSTDHAIRLRLVFTQGVLLVALVVLGGLGIGVVWTNCDAIISDLAKVGRLSTSLGTAGSFKEIGDMLGPLTIGAVSQFFGLITGFVTCGIMGLAGTALIVRGKGSDKSETR
jgi:MFS family permease